MLSECFLGNEVPGNGASLARLGKRKSHVAGGADLTSGAATLAFYSC